MDMVSVRGFLMDCRPAEVKSQQTMVRRQACHFFWEVERGFVMLVGGGYFKGSQAGAGAELLARR
jgi:hypothetical protein